MPPHVPSFRRLWYASVSVDLEENMVVAERFELVRMIGRGGVGSVGEARDRQAAAQLRSPHVVQVLDHGTWEGHPVSLARAPLWSVPVGDLFVKIIVQPSASVAIVHKTAPMKPIVAKPVASSPTTPGKDKSINLGF